MAMPMRPTFQLDRIWWGLGSVDANRYPYPNNNPNTNPKVTLTLTLY